MDRSGLESETVDDVMIRYHNALESILSSPSLSRSRGPTELLDYLYLGDFGDSASLGQLTELGITHLLNCAATYPSQTRLSFTGMRGYREIQALDTENYDLLAHYQSVESFIEEARGQGGKVLVYCAKGVNRSAGLCVAYLLVRHGMDLCEAVSHVAFRRGKILTNPGFRKQLVAFASELARPGSS